MSKNLGVNMHCNICKSKFYKENLIYKCHNCKFVQKIQIPNPQTEKNRYLNHVYDDGYKTYMYNHLKDILLDKNFNVLDFGCGQKPILDELFKTNNFTFYDKYFYQSNYKNKSYDLILLNEVIEHISNPLDILEELITLLNENGSIVISTELYDGKDFNDWWYFRDITHISFFSKETCLYISNLLSLSYTFKDSFIIFKKK